LFEQTILSIFVVSSTLCFHASIWSLNTYWQEISLRWLAKKIGDVSTPITLFKEAKWLKLSR